MAIKGNKATEDRIESEEVARLSAPRDFLSDQPKENPKDDLLGWDKIAENIAECVIANAGKRGFAIGICGRWGSGKTTLLNFIKQHLEDKAVLLDYNPWLVPGKNHVRLFYRDLAKRIGRGIPGENAKKIQRITSLISSFADVVVNPLASVIGPLFFILTTVFGGASIMTLIYRPITSWVLPIAFVVFLLLWLIRGLGHSVAKACSRLQKTTRLTMEELKSKLNAEFATLSKPIVVVIDDLDRLAGAEICEIFRLVRNNADLNNVVYLMAYDRAMVRDILKKDFVDAYSGFQDKVICLEYQLPPADQTVLDNYFKAELQRLLNTCPETIDQYWRDDRWGNYFLLYFRRWYDGFREINRMVNAIWLNMPAVINEGVFEVNPIDFVAFELIRVKWPDIYEFVKENKGLFAGVSVKSEFLGPSRSTSDALSETLNQYKALIGEMTPAIRTNIDEFLKEIFPRLEILERDIKATYSEPSYLTELRICAEEVFDRYFLYGNYIGDISNRDVVGVVRLIRTGGQWADSQYASRYTERLPDLVDRVLIQVQSRTPRDLSVNGIVRFLFEISDQLPIDKRSALEVPVRFRLMNWITESLRESDLLMRANVIEDILGRSPGFFASLIVPAILQAEMKDKPQEKWFIPAERLDRIVEMARIRGMSWLRDPVSIKHPQFLTMIWILKGWCTADEFNTALGNLWNKDIDFARFIAWFQVRSETVKYGEEVGPVTFRYEFKSLQDLVGLELVEARARRLSLPSDVAPEVRRGLELFINGIDRFRANPDE